jgi:mannose-6-phosphate isomerase-like protein (cupin superfamily)
MSIFQMVGVEDGQPLSGVICKISSESTDDAYTVLELKMFPGIGAPLHVHQREDEMFYILEGECEFICEGEKHVVGEGALVVLPKGKPHSFRNPRDSGLTRVMITAVPGGLDRYFAAIDELIKSGKQVGQEDVDNINNRFEIDFSPSY